LATIVMQEMLYVMTGV